MPAPASKQLLSSAEAKIDPVLKLTGHVRWAIEIKGSTSPKVTRGFQSAAKGLESEECTQVYDDGRGVTAHGGV